MEQKCLIFISQREVLGMKDCYYAFQNKYFDKLRF